MEFFKNDKVRCINLSKCEHLNSDIYTIQDSFLCENEKVLILKERPRFAYSSCFFQKVNEN